jgi:peptidoglycan-N-acetylglucosamine deacetylase
MIAHTGKIHQLLFPSLLWKIDSSKIFLTFDDGPHPVATPAVLGILHEHNIKGTFFLSGRAVQKHQSLVKEIGTGNHSIGIHAFNHARSLAFSKKRTMNEILQTEEAIMQAGARSMKIFRPPFGLFSWNTISAAKALGYKLVMWTTLTGDFRGDWPDERVCSTALAKLSAGSILVFHDNELTKSRIRRVLPLIIARIQERGFTFQSIQ